MLQWKQLYIPSLHTHESLSAEYMATNRIAETINVLFKILIDSAELLFKEFLSIYNPSNVYNSWASLLNGNKLPFSQG